MRHRIGIVRIACKKAMFKATFGRRNCEANRKRRRPLCDHRIEGKKMCLNILMSVYCVYVYMHRSYESEVRRRRGKRKTKPQLQQEERRERSRESLSDEGYMKYMRTTSNTSVNAAPFPSKKRTTGTGFLMTRG